MPKMFLHTVQGTFDAAARVRVARELTRLALSCEGLPETAPVMQSTWLYFADHPTDAVFVAGEPAVSQIISLVVYSLRGGLDAQGKQRLIEGATEILGRHSHQTDPVPAFVVIREVEENDWGMFGSPGDLEALRRSSDVAAPK